MKSLAMFKSMKTAIGARGESSTRDPDADLRGH